MLLEKLFILFGGLFVLSYVLGKLLIFKFSDAVRVGHYVAFVTALQGLNMVCGAGMLFTHHSILFKMLMLGYILSPFVLGHLASYHTEKIYSAVQMLLVMMSISMCFILF